MNVLCPRTGWRRSRGFSLPELLIVLAVSAILLGSALPGLQDLRTRTRARSAMMELRVLLEQARQAAITRSVDVTLCATNDGVYCTTQWHGAPVYVFIDQNRNRQWDGTDERLARTQLSTQDRIVWRGSGGRAYLRFDATGGVRDFGTFTYCPTPADPRHVRQVSVSFSGRPREVRLSPGAAENVIATVCT
jgi:type IV fimbrial biogenesis protein FimT